MVEAGEVEAVSIECHGCAGRIEMPWGGHFVDRPCCPFCGEEMAEATDVLRAFVRLYRAVQGSAAIRFRVRLLRQLPR